MGLIADHSEQLDNAKIAPQPAASAKIEPPASGWKDLNFKVAREFHKSFKLTAVKQGLSNVELLRRAYALYVEKFGDGE